MCVCCHVAKLKITITAEHRSNGISGAQRAQMAPKSSESFWKGHKNTSAAPPPVLPHPFTAGNTLLRLGPAWVFSPSSILSKLYCHVLCAQGRGKEKCLWNVKRSDWQFSDEILERVGECGAWGDNRWYRSSFVAVTGQETRREDAHAESYIKNESLIN